MKRLRIAFVLLAVALAVPLGLLVSRALASVALERATQHRAVAERVFDEMERALSRFLEGEEERPFEEYRAGLAEDEKSAAALARASGASFLLGHFQIEPDGSFRASALDESSATSGDERRYDDGSGKKLGRLESDLKLQDLVLRAWPSEERERPARIASAPPEGGPPPGATIERGRAAQKRAPAAMKDEAQEDMGETRLTSQSTQSSAFDLLRSLNRAGEERAERKQKVTQAPYAEVYGDQGTRAGVQAASKTEPRMAAAPPSSADAVRGPELAAEAAPTERYALAQPARPFAPYALSGVKEGRAAQSPVAEMEMSHATAASGSSVVGISVGHADEWASDLADEVAEEVAQEAGQEIGPGRELDEAEVEADSDAGSAAPGEVRITLDPMVGRRIDERYIVLSRTVLVGEQGYRQGFLVDTEALGRWLEERVLGDNGLAQLGQAWFLNPDEAPPGASAAREFAYEHRFAEPFDSLRVLLALEPLPGTASTRTIYQLAGLVALLALGGLAAVYRMVSVVVSYAERRNQFVAAVSHELKTPLTSIRMYAEMLRDGVVPEGRQREDYYATIHGESERLSRLIDNVLEFSRLERGSREFDFSVGDVGPVIREAAETLRPHVEREGFSLMVAVEEGLPPVRFDRDALLQVLFNLVDNALKYARSASRREVAITCVRESEGVALSVRDFGPGVPHRHHSRIFEAFYRGENELTRSAKGSGIGLALVKELTEAMGAGLQSGDAEGGGFRVSLRFAQAR